MYSHSDGEVWGLAQRDGNVITSGDDNQMIVWDPSKRERMMSGKISDTKKKAKRGGASTLSKLPSSQQSRCVATGTHFSVVAANDGSVYVYPKGQTDDSGPMKTFCDSDEWIEVMAFSPDQKMLAVGSHDNRIYVYDTGSWTLKGTCKGHSSYIMALDWSADSTYLRTNCGAYETLYWKSADCSQDPSGRSNTKATQWATSTLKFTWNTEGIYPSGADGTHINGVAGSHDGKLLACGDDFGLVTLFRDPCRKGGKPRCFRGHSEHVVRTIFSEDDGYLFSIGGYDQTLMQWKRQ